MEILCGLTPLEETIAKAGRGAGNKITKRLVIGAGKWCWNISIETEKKTDNTVAGQKYFKGFVHLLPSAQKDFDVDIDDCIDVIAVGVNDIAGGDTTLSDEQVDKIKTIAKEKSAEAAGDELDSILKSNYNIDWEKSPEEVLKRIFGENADISD